MGWQAMAENRNRLDGDPREDGILNQARGAR